jgi:glycosyltransferase involved in cell wall biosynthesis
MNIVHLCTSNSQGGAANAMRTIHNGLLKLGHKSDIIEKSGLLSKKNDVLSEVEFKCKFFENILIHRNRSPISNTHFSLDYCDYDFEYLDSIKNADIIHLHWVAGFISSKSLLRLSLLQKPICWTLHDLRPITGGCHFSAGCNGYWSNCEECPQIINNHYDLTQLSLEGQKVAVKYVNPFFIAPSSWLLDCIVKSTIGRNANSKLIPYGIDTDVFKPKEKKIARERLKLKQDVFYIFLGAHSFEEKRKGIGNALETLNIIKSNRDFDKKINSGEIRIAMAGSGGEHLNPNGWIIDKLGYIDQNHMIDLYSACDLMLFTSSEDNLPLMIMEACSCGLPVVAFDVGGIKDIIKNNIGGMLVNFPDCHSMAKTCIELIKDASKRGAIGIEARDQVINKFSLNKQTQSYIDTYKKQIVSHHKYNNINHISNIGQTSQLNNHFINLLIDYYTASQCDIVKQGSVIDQQRKYISELEYTCRERLELINKLDALLKNNKNHI